ncbi:MAG: ABC transporter ATP-binding protein, partial [Peptococcaceae bacterium]|nr:ABC transporter ATP-binding protein [Peptococcaceae bacterium]
MLKTIHRVLVLSGDLAMRIRIGFVFSFIDAICGMLPVGALFIVLNALENGQPLAAAQWRVVLCLLVGSVAGRIICKYAVYRLQSAAGFDFIARERMALGERLRRVPMGFFRTHALGDLTTIMTSDLNFLELYAMHLLDRITTGMVAMIVTGIFLLAFNVWIGVIFALGVACSFVIYAKMQRAGKRLAASQRQAQADTIAAVLDVVQGIAVIKSYNLAAKNLSGIERACEKSAAAAYSMERAFAPLNAAYGTVFRVTACALMLCAQLLALGATMTFAELAVILVAAF